MLKMIITFSSGKHFGCPIMGVHDYHVISRYRCDKLNKRIHVLNVRLPEMSLHRLFLYTIKNVLFEGITKLPPSKSTMAAKSVDVGPLTTFFFGLQVN